MVILTRVGISQPWYFNNLYNPNNTWSAGLSITSHPSGYMACALAGDQYNFYQISIIEIQNDGTLINYINYGQYGQDYWPGENSSFKNDGQNNFYLYGSIDYLDSNITKGLFLYFDSFGDSIFSREYESIHTNGLVGRNCNMTADYGFILTGEEYIDTSNNYDFCIIRIDPLGNEIWRKYLGTASWDIPLSIIQTPDLGYAIGGLTYSGAQITYDPLIIKTDSLGELEWMLNLGGEYKDDKAIVCNTSDSCIMVLTAFADSMYTPEHPYARVNLVKIDLEGNILWNKKYGLSSPKNYISNIISLDNGYFIACGSVKYSAFLNPVGWIFYFNSNADSIWYREYLYYPEDPSYGLNYLYDVSIAADNGFVAVGQAFTLSPPNNIQKMWVLKVDSAGCEIPNCWVGIEENDGMEAWEHGGLELWPNPARGIVDCRWSIVDFRGDFSLMIYDMYGREMMEISVPENEREIQFDVGNFPGGLYLVVVKDGGKIIGSAKLVINR